MEKNNITFSVETHSIMQRVSVKEAARELSMDVTCLQYMLRAERLPIGYAMKKTGNKRWSYYIYRQALDAYKKSLAVPAPCWKIRNKI